MLENCPQLVLQYIFMFRLELFNLIVIGAFISSIFNILLAMMSAAVFWILHRNQEDIPFTITLKWKAVHSSIISTSNSAQNLNPFTQCGQRYTLSQLLGKIPVKGELLQFEILSSTEESSGCLLSGVFVSEQSIGAESEDDLFSEFIAKQTDIQNAVKEAFKLDAFTAHSQWDENLVLSARFLKTT